MAYANLPPNLQSIFQDLTDRLTKLENAQRFTLPNTPPISSQPSITGLATDDPIFPRTGDAWLNTTSNALRYIDSAGAVQNVIPASINAPVTGNKIINGNFQFNQRDPSNIGIDTSANPLHQYYWDRWYVFADDQGLAATTLYTETPSTAPGALGLKLGEKAATAYAFSSENPTTSPLNNWVDCIQLIEQSNTTDLIGQPVTLSLRLAGMTSPQVQISIVWTNQSAFLTDTAGSWTTIASKTITPTTALTKYSLTTTIPSSYTSGTFGVRITGAELFYVKKQIWFTDIQLERGSIASLYQYAGNSIGSEFELCRRYLMTYIANELPIVNPYFNAALGTGQQIAMTNFPVSMRAVPALVDADGFSLVTILCTYYPAATGATTSLSVRYSSATTINRLGLAYRATDNGGTNIPAGSATAFNVDPIFLDAEL